MIVDEAPAPPLARRPRRSRDAGWWLFMRVSGVLLAVLVLGHVLDRFLIHDVGDVDYDFVARRWRNPFWRLWDGALLGLGLAHGFHGLRIVVEDLVADPRRRLSALAAVAVVAGVTLALAAITVVGV